MGVRPIIRCMTFKYNTKQRLGRGFSLQELKAAGISKKHAVLMGIAVDHRRRNKSTESMAINVQRLKEYQGKVVTFKAKSKPEDAVVEQLKGIIMPITSEAVSGDDLARAITAEEKDARSVFKGMRIARADARMVGIRQ